MSNKVNMMVLHVQEKVELPRIKANIKDILFGICERLDGIHPSLYTAFIIIVVPLVSLVLLTLISILIMYPVIVFMGW